MDFIACRMQEFPVCWSCGSCWELRAATAGAPTGSQLHLSGLALFSLCITVILACRSARVLHAAVQPLPAQPLIRCWDRTARGAEGRTDMPRMLKAGQDCQGLLRAGQVPPRAPTAVPARGTNSVPVPPVKTHGCTGSRTSIPNVPPAVLVLQGLTMICSVQWVWKFLTKIPYFKHNQW